MSSKPARLSRIDDLPRAQVYLIAGPAASGKTTFSSALAAYYNAAQLSMDNYFVDEDQAPYEYDGIYGRAPQWESPDAYDIATLKRNLQELLITGATAIPRYSFAMNKRDGYQPMQMAKGQVLIIEGLYTVRYQALFKGYCDSLTAIFMNAPVAERHARARLRDIEERGKPVEEFEKHYHFVTLGEQRWVLAQASEADYLIETSNHFSYNAFFRANEYPLVII